MNRFILFLMCAAIALFWVGTACVVFNYTQAQLTETTGCCGAVAASDDMEPIPMEVLR